MREFEEVLVRMRLAPEVAAAASLEYEQLALLVRPPRVPRVARDPDDDEVLAAAIAGHAEFVVTGDRDLLVLGEYEGCRIRTPRQFHGQVEASPT